MSASRLNVLLALLLLLIALSAPSCVLASDDNLPNFNAPVDSAPLNVDKVNKYFGVTIFKDPSLWTEDDASVAKRLGWPEESRTSSQSSYRLYPKETSPVSILGAQAYSCVLYATKGQPTEISIVFVNEGDYAFTQKILKRATELKPADEPTPVPSTNADENPSTNNAPHTIKPSDDFEKLSRLKEADVSRADREVHLAFEKALKQDAQTITDALTKLFGDPVHMSFGGGSETRERVLRWDWQGHAFLLATPRGTYVTLRIVPVAFADNYGKGDVIDRDELRAELLKRVKTSDSGDVVVGDIPMVDQGPKGYCVPATWERYMRYLGIPADMYVLAMAAGTTSDGGTNLEAMIENVDSLVTLYHRRIDVVSGDLDMKMISKNIDQGLPLMWSCMIHVPFERAISKRKRERNDITDWAAWAAELDTRDKKEIPDEITNTDIAGGHQRMIIGYNAKTGEIAISDSWSELFAIRWMTLREANAINAGVCFVIEP